MLKSIVAESYHDSPVEKKNGISNVPMAWLRYVFLTSRIGKEDFYYMFGGNSVNKIL